MQTGIVAGFGDVIGEARLAALRDHGFTLIRQDLQTVGGRTPDLVGVVAECEAWEQDGGRALYIVSPDTLAVVPDGSWVELLNEPEYLDPEAYAAKVRAAWAEVVERRLVLWAGCVGNTDADSLDWLQQVVTMVPEVTHISVHRYSPDSAQTPHKPHRGFATRAEEVEQLRTIIGARPYLVSEVGYHTGWRRKWLFWRTRLSPQTQASRLIMELDFWQAHGAQAVCLYQENDGPSSHYGDHYGLRDVSGAWKTSTHYGLVG